MRADALRHVDRWMDQGDFTRRGLGRFRILFGLLALVRVPQFGWIAGFPDAFYAPRPGPFMLFDGFPSEAFFELLSLGIAISTVAILVGWRTTTFSWAYTLLSLTGYGFEYSFGKIDHNILGVILPVFLAYAGWGAALSVDAARGRRLEVRQWGMRLYALAVAMAMATAALPKIRRGWLAIDTQAVRAQLLKAQYTLEIDTIGMELLSGVDSLIVWESLDWATVAFESAIVISVLTWRSFRVMLAVAALFHLTVLNTFDIAFSANIVAYAAFLRWDLIRLPDPGWAVPRRGAELAGPLVMVAGVATAYLGDFVFGALGRRIGTVSVWIAACAGGVYLLTLITQTVRRMVLGLREGRRTPAHSPRS